MPATTDGRMRERALWIKDYSTINLQHVLARMCRDSSIPDSFFRYYGMQPRKSEAGWACTHTSNTASCLFVYFVSFALYSSIVKHRFPVFV